ncbi:MAG TPA: hypothetical protein VH331_07320 [Allosphingosinicella sp.]|nr:hypothetical protein [Allosphingosinicella sp.]
MKLRAIATDRLFRIAAIANFAAFVIGTFWLGGDALNGAVRGGHYFLGMHRHFRQVSHATWLYSLLHEISVFALFVLAFAARQDAREQERRRD